jgi:hypothetical protein
MGRPCQLHLEKTEVKTAKPSLAKGRVDFLDALIVLRNDIGAMWQDSARLGIDPKVREQIRSALVALVGASSQAEVAYWYDRVDNTARDLAFQNSEGGF